jgi:hypothetical protein
MQKGILAGLLSAALLALTAGQAAATSCSPVNKPEGAGANAGTLTVNLDTGQVTADFNTNPAGHVTGGFLSVNVIAGGTTIDTANTFKNDLPDGAHASGPGDSMCDGVGIDDLAECGG